MSTAISFVGLYLGWLNTMPLLSSTILCFMLGIGIVYFVLERVMHL